ncbi:MAG: hypothetical protein SGJ27_09640 [Candidatus Melainabacteria bacterium]|nr:hypothetical protein [Candidatus Melainabacteria bacterium]
MVWTYAQPQRFIDDRKVVRTIKSIGESRLAELKSEKRFIEPVSTVLDELVHLAPAANLVKLECAQTPEGVREAIFQPAALELLKAKCRNRYWLWYLVSRLDTSTFPINPLAIARAHARAKAALHDNRYGFAFIEPISLIWELKALPPGFLFEMWDSGRVLADPRNDANGYGVMLNPLLIDD